MKKIILIMSVAFIFLASSCKKETIESPKPYIFENIGGLISWFPFNENFKDSVGNSKIEFFKSSGSEVLDLKLFNKFVDDRSGIKNNSCQLFKNYIDSIFSPVPCSFSIKTEKKSNNSAVNVWVKLENIYCDNYKFVVANDSLFYMAIKFNNDSIFLKTTINSKVYNKSIGKTTNNNWIDLAFVLRKNYPSDNTSTVFVYLNSEKVDSISNNYLNKEGIGLNEFSSNGFFTIDDLKIWDKALSDEEIKNEFLK